jgi:hypothetical protein
MAVACAAAAAVAGCGRVAVRGFPPDVKLYRSQCARERGACPLGCGQPLGGLPFLRTSASGSCTGSFEVYPPGSATGPQPVHVPANAAFTVLRRLGSSDAAQQLVAGGGALFIQSGANSAASITRIELATGRSAPRFRVARFGGMTYGGGLLWIVRGTQPTSARESVLGISAGSLAVRHAVTLPAEPGWSTSPAAYAGGLVWVATLRALVAIDPATGTPVRTVPVTAAGPQNFMDVAASADGTALWTAESSGGGGPIAVQLRNPATGAVLAAAPGPAIGLGGAQIAAADHHAWLAYATGMMGSYVQAATDGPDALAELRPAGRAEYSNGIRVYQAGQQLWLTDGMAALIACAAAPTGRILATARRVNVSDLAPLAAGRLALIIQGQVFDAAPKPACGP